MKFTLAISVVATAAVAACLAHGDALALEWPISGAGVWEAKRHIMERIEQHCRRPTQFAALSQQWALPTRYDSGRRGKNRKYRIPPEVKFVNLTARPHEWSGKFRFAIGLGAVRGVDPDERVDQLWDYFLHGDALPAKGVTTFAGFELSLEQPRLILHHLQACVLEGTPAVTSSHERGVAPRARQVVEQLEKRKEREPPLSGAIHSRVENTWRYGVPWAYADRALLLAALSVRLANELGARELEILRRPGIAADRRRVRQMIDRVMPFLQSSEVGQLEVFKARAWDPLHEDEDFPDW